MKEEKLTEFLSELADVTAEPVRSGLAEDIKQQIPHKLAPHTLDTINVMIDLRISKLTAAAIIIITMVLLAGFLGARDQTGVGMYHDSKMLVKHLLGSQNMARSDIVAGVSSLYEYLVQQGRDAVYYGDSINATDSYAILMHWKLPDGNYSVVLVVGDSLRINTVSADELIKMQAGMLQDKRK
jgi:hypothetical protein